MPLTPISRFAPPGKLPYNIREGEVRDLISAVSEVDNVVLKTGRGYAFVKLKNDADNETVIAKLNGHIFEGSPITVSLSTGFRNPNGT